MTPSPGIRTAIGLRSVSSGSTGRVQIWDTADRRILATLDGHAQWSVGELAFHPGGDLLVTMSGDGTSRLWDAKTGRLLVNWPAAMGGDLHFSLGRDGVRIYRHRWTGAADGGGRRSGIPDAREQPGQPVEASIARATSARTGSSPSGWTTGPVSGTWPRAGRSPILPDWWTDSVSFVARPDGRELLTCGFGGLRRWPIREDPDVPGRLRIGPSRVVDLPLRSDTCRRPPGRSSCRRGERELGDGTGRGSAHRGRAVHPGATRRSEPRRAQPGRPVGGDERLAYLERQGLGCPDRRDGQGAACGRPEHRFLLPGRTDAGDQSRRRVSVLGCGVVASGAAATLGDPVIPGLGRVLPRPKAPRPGAVPCGHPPGRRRHGPDRGEAGGPPIRSCPVAGLHPGRRAAGGDRHSIPKRSMSGTSGRSADISPQWNSTG